MSTFASLIEVEHPAGDDDGAIPFDLEDVRELREALELFAAQPGVRAIAKRAAAAWGVRALLGPPSIGDAAMIAGVVFTWPWQEWFAHKYLLHLRPRTLFGRPFDPLFARYHRAHHAEPRDLRFVMVPEEVIRSAFPASIALFGALSLGSPRRWATGVAAYSTMALLYEWTHFLVHTGVRPKGAFFKRVRRNHRLHHYRNEHHWLSFVWPDVDKWMGTEPAPRDVPRSSTARDLHGTRGE